MQRGSCGKDGRERTADHDIIEKSRTLGSMGWPDPHPQARSVAVDPSDAERIHWREVLQADPAAAFLLAAERLRFDGEPDEPIISP
jgi:hypothetical protein